MHRAGLIVWDVLNGLREAVRPGVTTLELEKLAERLTTEHGARSAFKGYRGYPCVLCASVNQEIVHGIPSATRRVKEGFAGRAFPQLRITRSYVTSAGRG